MEKIVNGVHTTTEEEQYVTPMQPEVIDKLEQFKDMKLGFMTHFGIYNQLALIESWPLSDELDQGRWSQGQVDWTDDMEVFKKQYWNLNRSFNPGSLDPERFANTIAGLGFKYTLLPTKHHDGFCMWDTKYSDYRVTHPDCPFSENEHSDIFGRLTEEFQKLGIMTGAYFSKVDWHCDDYWPESFKNSGATHRNVGYDVNIHPEKWEKFREFTKNQMLEIVSKYDPIDIMWLDGGQVNPRNNQDIRLSEICEEMRKINPGLIVCDRTIGGENENYITPEQNIPDYYLPIPWESCISLGGPFSFYYNDQYKSPSELTKIFVKILCRGGNLALNIAPQPNGKIPIPALLILSQFSDWVKANENAIYGTRPVAPYFNGRDGLVKDKEGNHYLFVGPAHNQFIVPKYLHTWFDVNFKTVSYLGQDIEFKRLGKKWRFVMPKNQVDRKEPLYYVFKVTLDD